LFEEKHAGRGLRAKRKQLAHDFNVGSKAIWQVHPKQEEKF
jgi:hypothetical protein